MGCEYQAPAWIMTDFYMCSACGFITEDIHNPMDDLCPECNKPTLRRQVMVDNQLVDFNPKIHNRRM
jgi:rubrerythrin